MPEITKLPGYHWFDFLKNVAVRMGLYSGACLSAVFSAWILIANRAPFLEPFARERNVGAVSLIVFFASLPVIRFYRSPAELLGSGLVSWGLLTLTYEGFCFHFSLLEQYYSAFQVFMVGAVCYFVFATLSWIGTIIWRVRAETHGAHQHH